jgi:uncharacterized protein YndB with AHSA1/START domain
MQKISVERSIWINAPRERVWQAITDPAQFERWFAPGTQWQSSGMVVGGTISMRDPQTGEAKYIHVIEVLDAPHRLVMRSQPEPPATPEITTYTLDEEDGDTRLTLTYSGYELMSEDVRQRRLLQDEMGFGMMLDNVKAHIEGKPLPYPDGF